MTRRPHRRSKGSAPQGTALAFLALFIQALLPFLVAYEIALASTPAYAADEHVICSAGAASNPSDHAAHHGVAGGCALCVALAANQAFTAPAPVALPLPQAKPIVRHRLAETPQAFAGVTASYNSRAPPIG